MSVPCYRKTSGGKGNNGMFIERDPKICAAGRPSSVAEPSVKKLLKHYTLEDKVDALVNDAIRPAPETKIYYSRRPPPRDMRHVGIFTEGSELINPPMLNKTQEIINDLKETVYESYWHKAIGKVRDPVPNLPKGVDTVNTTFGSKTKEYVSLYDIIMPQTSVSHEGQDIQTVRHDCKPPYSKNITFGWLPKSKTSVKCCLTDDRKILGINQPINTILADAKKAKTARLGVAVAPNDNIRSVPIGHTFGIETTLGTGVLECLTTCKINPDRQLFWKSLSHLNSLRKCLSKKVDGAFFNSLYLQLKHLDKNRSGWLPKTTIYQQCNSKSIIFTPLLLEPLLSFWKAYNGSEIYYKKFVDVINFRIPSPELPKIPFIPKDCDEFSTTYGEMVKPGKKEDERIRAGEPSGKYISKDFPVTPKYCCKADNYYLPEESDVRACLGPSVFTQMGISHRDMYAKREPHVIRRVFEASGESFTDDTFNSLWKSAEKYHSQGWVSYETFRRALNNQ